jgi:7-keto-8-aminopelargonate synthetase-like enzyme
MIVLDSAIGNCIFSNGKQYSYFGGNNYLGLANHPVIKEAVIQTVSRYGVNFSASRRTSGTASIHLELEKQLSLFKGKEDTAVFASGYQGNGILLDILRDRYDVVLVDQLAHASIISGIPRDVNFRFYDHCDADHLDYLLGEIKKPLVITDGIFALTGEIAPLNKIYKVVEKHDGILVVDDAHATGILGKTGKGTPEHFNLPEDAKIFQTETMSKALGSYGGFISGNKDIITLIREKSATYQASTALPPPIVAAGIASLKMIRDNPDMPVQLLKKAKKLREGILRSGFKTSADNTPIIPIILSSSEKAKKLNLFLEENGIVVPFMNYPLKNEMHLLRIAVTLEHTEDQTDLLLELLQKWIKKKCSLAIP